MNSPVQTAADYGWTSGEAEDSHEYLRPVVLRAVQLARERLGERTGPLRIFDAGCGNGALLRDLHGRGHQVAGCDASESGVHHARLNCAAVRIEHLSVCEDMSGLFGSDWDVVVATEVVEHLYAPREFVKQAGRLLKPGGMLILSTPYHGYIKNLALALTGAMDAHFTALWDGGHIKFWSYRTLTALLSEAGFVEHRLLGAGRLPWLWKSMVVCSRKSGTVGKAAS